MNKRLSKKLAKKRAEKSRSYSTSIYNTGAEVQSAVNRINNRIKTAVEHFGINSNIVQSMFSKLDALIPLSNIRYNKEGIMQIARPYQLYKDSDMHVVINNLDSHGIERYSDIKSRYSQNYENYAIEKDFIDGNERFNITIDKFINVVNKFDTALAWAYDNQYTQSGANIINIMTTKGGHTYRDLISVVEEYERAMS